MPSSSHLSTILLITWGSACVELHWRTPEERPVCDWDYMIFAVVWPAGFCVARNNSDCRVPQHVQYWTIHGLWPQGVMYCCKCWPIFHSDLQGIEDQLNQFWPNLKKQSSFNFWKEEWIKHGVCAGCVEGMNSPVRFFQVTLKLRTQLDIDRAMADAGIKPSCNQPYQHIELSAALVPMVGDVFWIQCVTDDKGREVLVQLKIPVFQNLTLGCYNALSCHDNENQYPLHPCPTDSTIFYFPINHTNPAQPCD
ncbi:ribonuclease T2-like [Denticeps clupeoides]|uniref:Uncharacterized protein n=1 Tax=Denticeps clupeoides TaxID=299321 RepID=A0AAY4E8Q4_9TELE|nr:ribonuclease Oy-like [Denticeps clupeoides]